MREFIGELIEAVPDLHMEVLATTTEGERCAVHVAPHAAPSPAPAASAASRPPAAALELEGCRRHDGRATGWSQSNDAFTD